MDLMVGRLQQASPEGYFLNAFFCALNAAGVRYAVMRNYASLPHSADGSDLDILVTPGDQETLRDILFRSIERSNGVAIGCSSTLGFFKVFAFGLNQTGIESWWGLRIDVNVGYSFRGADVIEMEHICEFQRVYNGVQVLTSDLAAVLGVLKEVLNNDHMPERYLRDADRAVRGDWARLNRILRPLGERGLALLREIILEVKDSAHVVAQAKALRRALFWQSMKKSPVSYLGNRLLHEWAKVRRYLCPSGVVIAVLGVDGVGKSTVISAIEPVLKDATHGALQIKHLRPGLLPPLARLKGKQVGQTGPVLDPHGSTPSGVFGSVFRLLYLTADYVLGYWLLLRPKVAKSPTVILFDRYCYDMALDPRRFRIGIRGRVVDWFLSLIPKPDVVLCLHADLHTIMARKQELPLAEITRQVNSLRDLAQREARAILISTEGTPEDVRDRLLKELQIEFGRRNLKRRI
ncbi:MAG: hypothetical protein NUW14_04795 [Deltaproteobacteria bacterium]|nr:hypothetical protein [Deltaproteobacteria bacterium]